VVAYKAQNSANNEKAQCNGHTRGEFISIVLLKKRGYFKVSGKANKVLGLIKRNLWNCPKQVKETAYTAIVRPKLENACAAWDPYPEVK